MSPATCLSPAGTCLSPASTCLSPTGVFLSPGGWFLSPGVPALSPGAGGPGSSLSAPATLYARGGKRASGARGRQVHGPRRTHRDWGEFTRRYSDMGSVYAPRGGWEVGASFNLEFQAFYLLGCTVRPAFVLELGNFEAFIY